MVLPPAFRSGAVSVKILLLHHQGSFHFLPAAWLGPGPQVGGRRFFRPQHHPSPQPSLPVLGRLAVLFHTFSTEHLCFFTLVTSTPSRLGMGDGAGTILQGHWLHISGSCFFPMLFGDPLCVSSNGGDFQWWPWWPGPLVQRVCSEVCVLQSRAWGICTLRQNSPCIWPSDFSY